jgi:hypothetical protein
MCRLSAKLLSANQHEVVVALRTQRLSWRSVSEQGRAGGALNRRQRWQARSKPTFRKTNPRHPAAGNCPPVRPQLPSASSLIFSLAMGAQKAGPAGAGVKPRLGAKKRSVAAHAAEESFFAEIPVGAGKCHLCVRLPRDFDRRAAELFSPFLVAFDDPRNEYDALPYAYIGEFQDGNHLRLTDGWRPSRCGLRASVMP